MEINKTFETYVIKDDEEIRVEVTAEGDLVEDGFDHEFGFTSNPFVSNVFITNIYDIDNDSQLNFKSLTKGWQKKLLTLAEEELNESEMFEVYNE